MSVFVDPEFGGPPTVSAQEARGKEPAAWCHIGTVADKRKENVQQPSKWSEAKVCTISLNSRLPVTVTSYIMSYMIA